MNARLTSGIGSIICGSFLLLNISYWINILIFFFLCYSIFVMVTVPKGAYYDISLRFHEGESKAK